MTQRYIIFLGFHQLSSIFKKNKFSKTSKIDISWLLDFPVTPRSNQKTSCAWILKKKSKMFKCSKTSKIDISWLLAFPVTPRTHQKLIFWWILKISKSPKIAFLGRIWASRCRGGTREAKSSEIFVCRMGRLIFFENYVKIWKNHGKVEILFWH